MFTDTTVPSTLARMIPHIRMPRLLRRILDSFRAALAPRELYTIRRGPCLLYYDDLETAAAALRPGDMLTDSDGYEICR